MTRHQPYVDGLRMVVEVRFKRSLTVVIIFTLAGGGNVQLNQNLSRTLSR